jgi:ParB family chromosome partitioning protein
VVRPAPGVADAYEIIAGERRWRASQRAGLHEVPVVVLEVDDRTSLEYAIVENVQRADLNPIEEAAGYERLIAEFAYSQADLATIIGKSRSHVANTLRLLKLPANIQSMLLAGDLTAGHARALLAVSDPETVARRIVERGLNVRDVERIAREEEGGETKSAPLHKARREKDPDTRALEGALEDVLGLRVAIDHRGQTGEMRIRYESLEQLDGLCRRLKTLVR